MRSPTHPLLAFTLLLAVTVGACRRNREAPAPVIPPVTIPDTAAEREDADAARARMAREAAEREARTRDEQLRVRAILTAPIHFAFDRSDLTLDARSALDEKLSVLRSNAGIRIRVEGHADERGSSEYNMALGMRRAAAARRYLLQRGIAAGRVDISTFGEERPICAASTEECWRANRRAEFVVVSS